MKRIGNRTLLGAAFLLLLFAFIPLHFAHAQFEGILSGLGGVIAGAIQYVVNPVLNLIFGFLAGIFEDMFAAMAFFMKAIIEWFMSMQVAPGAEKTPQFVKEAWGFTRNLVNITFVLILVFIGLATILRLQNYQFQRTLPALLIIALLVNFSGVLVGFVVDIGNILTQAFLADVGEWNLGDLNPWSGISFTASPVLQLVRIIFYLVGSLILFIVMLLFAVRVMILWTLSILAPLAFGAYILPATRRYWDQWLQQLIQWSIIGIPISFFLFLAQQSLDLGAVGEPGGLSAQVTGFFAPLTALFLLAIGVMLSMQLAPASAQGIISRGKKWGIGVGALAGAAAWRRIGSRVEGFGTRLREGAEKQPLVPAGAGLLRRTAARTGGFGTRTIARWAGRGIEVGSRTITTGLQASDDAKIAAAERAATNQDPNANITRFITAVGRKDWDGAVGTLAATIDKNNDTDEIRKAADSGKIRWEDVNTAFKHAQRHGNPAYFRPILKGFLDKMQDGTLEVSEGNRASIWEKLTARDITAKVTDIKSLAESDPAAAQKLADDIFLKADSSVTTALMRHPTKTVRDWAVRYAESKGEDWFINNRREDTLNAIISSGGRTMGVPVFGGLTRNDVNKKVMLREAGSSAQDLREQKAELELRRDAATSDNARRDIRRQIDAIEQALEYKEKALPDLQAEQATAQKRLQDAQRDISRLEKKEKSLQRTGASLDPADKTTLEESYKLRAQTEQLLAKTREELAARGRPPRRPGGPAGQRAQLLTSEGALGKTYQAWTRHEERAGRIDEQLKAVESGIAAIKDDGRRRQALDRFREIGTIAKAEKVSAATIKESIRKELPKLRPLPNEKRAEYVKPLDERLKNQGVRLQQARRDLENLKKIAQAGEKERKLESEP